MEEIFFQDTIEEWFGCFFTPLVKKVEATIQNCNEQMLLGGRIRDYKSDGDQKNKSVKILSSKSKQNVENKVKVL